MLIVLLYLLTLTSTHAMENQIKEENIILNLFKHRYCSYGADLAEKLEIEKESLYQLSPQSTVEYIKKNAYLSPTCHYVPPHFEIKENFYKHNIAKIYIFLPKTEPEKHVFNYLISAAYFPICEELSEDTFNFKYDHLQHAFIQSACSLFYALHPFSYEIVASPLRGISGTENVDYLNQKLDEYYSEFDKIELYCLYFPLPLEKRLIQKETSFLKNFPSWGQCEPEELEIKEKIYNFGFNILKQGPSVLKKVQIQTKITDYF